MFSTLAVVVAVVLCVGASANFHAKVQSRVTSVAAKVAALKSTVKATTAPTYVYTTTYNSTGCTGTPAYETVIGTNLCLALSYSGNGASSMQYMWDATTDVVSAAYYSDTACTTATTTDVYMNFTGYAMNTCIDLGFESGMFSTSSSYSLNPGAGIVISYAPTSSECSANQFIESFFMGDGFTDDDLAVTLTCYASTYTGYADFNTFTGSAYVSYSSVSGGGGSSSSSDSCFAGSETVLLENGEVKAISEVAIGDSILASDAAGNTKFSNVVAVPHGSNSVNAEFVQLTVASGADIKMTPEHLVMVSKGCDSVSSLMAASAVESGMCLQSTSGMEVVEKVESVFGRGIYSVVTEEEFVVVNGFVASPFAVNHAVANAYYNIVRAIPSLMNFELVKKATNVFGSLVTAFSA